MGAGGLPHNTSGPSPTWLEAIQPLAKRAETWQAIPGVSNWVLGIIKQGYSLQFAWRPPRFSGVVPTLVQSKDAHILARRWWLYWQKNGPSSSERVRLLKPLLPHPQKGWQPSPSSISELWTVPSWDGCSGCRALDCAQFGRTCDLFSQWCD